MLVRHRLGGQGMVRDGGKVAEVNADLEDFFPTTTFDRVRGAFEACGSFAAYQVPGVSQVLGLDTFWK